MQETEDEQNHLAVASTLSVIVTSNVDVCEHERLAYATRTLRHWSADLDFCANV
jgi:hypothetical protein